MSLNQPIGNCADVKISSEIFLDPTVAINSNELPARGPVISVCTYHSRMLNKLLLCCLYETLIYDFYITLCSFQACELHTWSFTMLCSRLPAIDEADTNQ